MFDMIEYQTGKGGNMHKLIGFIECDFNCSLQYQFFLYSFDSTPFSMSLCTELTKGKIKL